MEAEELKTKKTEKFVEIGICSGGKTDGTIDEMNKNSMIFNENTFLNKCKNEQNLHTMRKCNGMNCMILLE